MFSPTTKVFLYGKHVAVAQRMLDFDFLCGKKEPSLVGLVSQGQHGTVKLFWGDEERLFPLLGSLDDTEDTGARMMINFASFRSAIQTTREAMSKPWIDTITIVAEGIPERDVRMLGAEREQYADAGRNITLIGPSTVGGIAAGVLRIGHSGGSLENMISSHLYAPGSVGLLSKSGGMMNELCRVISRHTDGLHTGVSFGGDRFPLLDIRSWLLDYEACDEIEVILMLDEVGSSDPLVVCDMIKQGLITKPVVMRVSGLFAEQTTQSVQFGHAGAKAQSSLETTSAKLSALRAVGVHVPESYDDFGTLLGQVWSDTTGSGWEERSVPHEVTHRLQIIQSRKGTQFSASISDERGDVLTYNKVPVTDLVAQGSLGKVLGLLRLKKELPDYACRFLESTLILLADHGPAVSGAHNTIVTARAGKDLVSSVISGLVTIGPRFGGAIDGAARWLFDAVSVGKDAKGIIDDHKRQGVFIQGIGHKVKSVYNPDTRCTLLSQLAAGELKDASGRLLTGFPSTRYLQLAKEVEALTVQKKANLILNVDGHIAALLLDMCSDIGLTHTEIEQLIQGGLCNGLFVLGRSIGLIGHYLDQQRLDEGLYRTPWSDILYL